MANFTNADGDHASADLWVSHNKMVLEPLDANDPEVRGFLGWKLAKGCIDFGRRTESLSYSIHRTGCGGW